MGVDLNIFYLSSDIDECAMLHTDKHVVKMILEYAQLLSTAHRVLDGKQSICISDSGRKKKVWMLSDEKDQILYTATHINHPSAIWVRQSSENYRWLYALWSRLLTEYTHRYEKLHKTSRLCGALSSLPLNIKVSNFTEPPKAMPVQFDLGDTVTSYRAYYVGAKSHLFNWKRRSIPEWTSCIEPGPVV